MHSSAPLGTPTPAELIRFLIAWVLLCGGIGAALGRIKGLTRHGFIYGLLLGPVGLMLILLKQPSSDPESEMSTPRRRLKPNGRVLKWAWIVMSLLIILVWIGSAVFDVYYIRPYTPPRAAPANPWSQLGVTGQYVIGMELKDSVFNLENTLWFTAAKGRLATRKTMGLHIKNQAFDLRRLLPGKIVPWMRTGPTWGIELPFWVLFVCVAIPTARLSWRDRPFPPHTCQQCGYDLTGNTSGVCPECGDRRRI